jgi:hypothetical protein
MRPVALARGRRLSAAHGPACLTLTLLLGLSGLAPAAPQSPEAAAPLKDEEAEAFLKNAKIVAREPIGVGITHPDKLTLEDGGRTAHALWKTINEHKAGMQKLASGASEFDFRDSYKAEIAAYHLDRLLGLDLVPPTVERRIGGRVGSVQLWVEDAMTQLDRKQKGLEPPDQERWNQQMHNVRLFHQLTYNTDYQNIRNVLMDASFRIYLVDSSRAFHIQTDLMTPDDLVRFSRSTLQRLKALDEKTLQERLSPWVGNMQISSLLKRRDKILALVEQRVAEKGEAEVYFP